MTEKKDCDVIVTYCWNRVGYNILRSLSDKGIKVWAADTSQPTIRYEQSFVHRHIKDYYKEILPKLQ